MKSVGNGPNEILHFLKIIDIPKKSQFPPFKALMGATARSFLYVTSHNHDQLTIIREKKYGLRYYDITKLIVKIVYHHIVYHVVAAIS